MHGCFVDAIIVKNTRLPTKNGIIYQSVADRVYNTVWYFFVFNQVPHGHSYAELLLTAYLHFSATTRLSMSKVFKTV